MATDIKARAIAKQLLLSDPAHVDTYAAEVVAADSSFVTPSDLRARVVSKQVLLSALTTVDSYAVEVVIDAQAEATVDLRAFSLTKQVLLTDNPRADSYTAEIVVEDTSFIPPPSLQTRTIAKQVLMAEALDAVVDSFSIEAVGKGYVATQVDEFSLEAVIGLPYAVQADSYSVEVIAESTLAPPTPAQVAFWFTVINP